MKRFLLLLVLLGGGGYGFPALAEAKCDSKTGLPMSLPPDAPWSMQIRLEPSQVPLNAPFDARVTICSRSGDLPDRITVDATMPAHKHGMNYEPEISRADRHSFEVKNLLFHMPGVWRLVVTAFENNEPHRFIYEVTLQ
ncbi:MAG: hypothetical protein NXI27_25810 [Alphaproteobacteria bacterium]|nr:hypothetical protein [Alphaproteobacteria bacterium]